MKLTLAREQLAAIVAEAVDITAGVIDHLPDSIAPPVVLVAWSDPWLKPDTFLQYQAAMELLCVAQRLEPGGQLDTLESLVSAIVPAVRQSQWFQVVDVTSPYPLLLAGVDYLAASINITHDVESE